MIDYGTFQFACLPNVGGEWFCQVLKQVGGSVKHIEMGGIYSHFPVKRNGEFLRVSMVRHPCDWLVSCFDYLKKHPIKTNSNAYLFRIGQLPYTTLNEFIYQYLQIMPGEITKLSLAYQADSFFRIEDMPWALIEFLELIGKPRPNTFPTTTVFQLSPSIDDTLRRRLMKTEEKMCDAFDYY